MISTIEFKNSYTAQATAKLFIRFLREDIADEVLGDLVEKLVEKGVTFYCQSELFVSSIELPASFIDKNSYCRLNIIEH